MKAIFTKTDNVVKYLFPDETEILVTAQDIRVPGMIVCDLNAENAEVVTVPDESVPEEWIGNAYTWDAELGEFWAVA